MGLSDEVGAVILPSSNLRRRPFTTRTFTVTGILVNELPWRYQWMFTQYSPAGMPRVFADSWLLGSNSDSTPGRLPKSSRSRLMNPAPMLVNQTGFRGALFGPPLNHMPVSTSSSTRLNLY